MLITILSRSFGGLRRSYYFRNLCSGGFMLLCASSLYFQKDSNFPSTIFYCLAIGTLLYPYSCFVYDSIIDFFRGDDIIITNPFNPILFSIRMALRVSGWLPSIFIAPVGLIWLYFSHARDNKKQRNAEIRAEAWQREEIRKRIMIEEEIRAELQAEKERIQ